MTVTYDQAFCLFGEQGNRLLKTECLIAGYYDCSTSFFYLKKKKNIFNVKSSQFSQIASNNQNCKGNHKD